MRECIYQFVICCQLVCCLRFTYWQHLWLDQVGYWLVTAYTHGKCIVLPHWETSTMTRYPIQSHYLYSNNAECMARKRQIWLNLELNSWLSAWETCALLIRLSRLVSFVDNPIMAVLIESSLLTIHSYICCGVMKMENIGHRVRTEPASLAFWSSVITISSPKLPNGIILHTCLCDSLPERSVHTTRLVPLELQVL